MHTLHLYKPRVIHKLQLNRDNEKQTNGVVQRKREGNVVRRNGKRGMNGSSGGMGVWES